MKHLFSPAIVILAAAVALPSPALGQTYDDATATHWQGPTTGGDFFEPLNWSLGVPAGYERRAMINTGAEVVLEAASAATSSLYIGSRDGNTADLLEVKGTALTLYQQWEIIGTTASGHQDRIVAPGIHVYENARLIFSEGSTLAGYKRQQAGSAEQAAGTVVTLAGGSAVIRDSGTAIHAFTSLIGNASLEVSGSARYTGELNIGVEGSSTAEVKGAGTTMEATLYLGRKGNGHLLISEGAKVVSTEVELGRDRDDETAGSGTIRLTGNGSELHVHTYEFVQSGQTYVVGGHARIGVTGEGSLIVSDGASLTSEKEVILGWVRGRVNFNDPYSYNSRGVLQIGEGGRAGSVEALAITSGYGNGGAAGPNAVIFNHDESNYLFHTAILAANPATLPSDSKGAEIDVNDVGEIRVSVLGGGRTTLSGANTYTGGTVITHGALVAGHATALGTGFVEVGADGELALADTVETLSLGETTLEGGSTLAFLLKSAESDPVAFSISGGLTLEGRALDPIALELSLPLGFTPVDGYTWSFLSTSDGITGFDASFFTINLSGWDMGQDGNDLYLTYSGGAAAVPEPSALALLLALGGSGLLLRRRRRNH